MAPRRPRPRGRAGRRRRRSGARPRRAPGLRSPPRAPFAGRRPGPPAPPLHRTGAPGRREPRRRSPRPTGGSWPGAPRSATPRRPATRPARRSRWRRRSAWRPGGGRRPCLRSPASARPSPRRPPKELAHRAPVLGVGRHPQVQGAQAAVDEEAVERPGHGAHRVLDEAHACCATRARPPPRHRRPRRSGRPGTWWPSAPRRPHPARVGAESPGWRRCCRQPRSRRRGVPRRPRCRPR